MRRRARQLRNALSLAGYVSRHPVLAGRTLLEATERDDGRRFQTAMRLLTGLDVDLKLERGGFVWVLPPSSEGIADSLFKRGSYSADETAAVLAYARAERAGRDCIVDVGAHIGTIALPLAKAGYRVVAIEPVPRTARYLKSNIAANDLEDSVTVVEAAVGDGERVLISLSTSAGLSEVVTDAGQQPAYSRLARYGTGPAASRASVVSVPALGLDEVVARTGFSPDSVALVWADTQGSEIASIRSGAALWRAGVPLFMEFWPMALEKHGGTQRLVDEAKMHFSSFIPSTRLIGGDWQPQPLAELTRLIRDPESSSDLLLVP